MADSYLAEGTASDRSPSSCSSASCRRTAATWSPPASSAPSRYLRACGSATGRSTTSSARGTCRRPLLARLATASASTATWTPCPRAPWSTPREPLLRVEGDLPRVPAGRDAAPEPGQLPDADRHQGRPDRRPPPTGGPWSTSASAARTAPRPGLLAARAPTSAAASPPPPSRPGMQWGVPTTGTMAHSYVIGVPDRGGGVLRVPARPPGRADAPDRHLRHRRGAHAARRGARGRPASCPGPCGSTPATSSRLAPRCAASSTRAASSRPGSSCSGDLDEYRIADLVAAGAPIDGFGVGTRLVTVGDAPALGGVYKLVESAGRPVMKAPGPKATLPGRHQVFRGEDGDVIGLVGEDLPGTPLLEPVLAGGAPRRHRPPLIAMPRPRRRARLARCPRRAGAARSRYRCRRALRPSDALEERPR